MWEAYKKGYKAWLQLERSLSDNSVEAYLRDIEKLTQFLQATGTMKTPADIELKDLRLFLKWISELALNPASQARILSGIRSFYKYCSLEQIVKKDPTLLLESPRQKRALPDFLSFEEIEAIIDCIDLSRPEGGRNKAILETMYSCGLRVSEVVGLRLSCLYLDTGFIRVIGKGDKERLSARSGSSAHQIHRTLSPGDPPSTPPADSRQRRHPFPQSPGNEAPARVMIFLVIKALAKASGITQKYFPAYLPPIPLPPTWWSERGRSAAPSRRCWGTRALRQRRSILTWTENTCARPCTVITRLLNSKRLHLE